MGQYGPFEAGLFWRSRRRNAAAVTVAHRFWLLVALLGVGVLADWLLRVSLRPVVQLAGVVLAHQALSLLLEDFIRRHRRDPALRVRLFVLPVALAITGIFAWPWLVNWYTRTPHMRSVDDIQATPILTLGAAIFILNIVYYLAVLLTLGGMAVISGLRSGCTGCRRSCR